MGGRQLQISSPLDAAVAKIKKQEKNFWGRIQSWSHRCLVRLENLPLLQNYSSFLKGREGVAAFGRKPTIDLDSLFFLSLLFHLLLFFLLTRITLPPSAPDNVAPIRVTFLDLGEPVQTKAEKVQKQEQKVARVQPKLPRPLPKPEPVPISPPSQAAPLLPAPKALARIPAPEVVAPVSESLESLIRLPTKQSEAAQASPKAEPESLPVLARRQEVSVPEKLLRGQSVSENVARASPPLTVTSNPDFGPYFEMIKKRVQSVWEYPEKMAGKHQVELLFVLDRGGKVVRVEILGSSDTQLDRSALRAVNQASPFPPIPESLRELAGQPLRLTFDVDFGVLGRR